MVNKDRLDTIVNNLLTSEVFSNTWRRLEVVPRVYRERGVVAALQGEIIIGGLTVLALIGFRSSFPLSVPLIFLMPFDALGYIPHVDEDGFVCYVQGDSQFINYNDPVAIVQSALARSVATLNRGYQGENKNDFIDGFAEYWSRLPGSLKEMSLITPGKSLRKIVQATTVPNKEDKLDYFADDEKAVRSLTLRLKDQKFTIGYL